MKAKNIWLGHLVILVTSNSNTMFFYVYNILTTILQLHVGYEMVNSQNANTNKVHGTIWL